MSNRNVFINCPFSDDYRDQFHAIIFTVIRSGFTPRCARENDDGGEVRIEKICRIIRECPYSVHDISKTDLDAASNLPRFNMPFELGLYLGAKKFGGRGHSSKKSLILDVDQYRYQEFISDIAGQDIASRGGTLKQLITRVATWLRDAARDPKVPGGAAISKEYDQFGGALPQIVAVKDLQPEELTFKDYVAIVTEWILFE